jgi:hypothetical protein
MLRVVVTALAILLVGPADGLVLTSPLSQAVASSVSARSIPAVMMAKKATKSKLIPILLEADIDGLGSKGCST